MKLKPGYMYDSRGRPVMIDKRARKKNELAAIRASYAAKKRKGLDPFPAIRMVLDMDIKLTPRRRELLMAVMHDTIGWHLTPIYMPGYRTGGWHWQPTHGGSEVNGTLSTLRKLRLLKLYGRMDNVNVQPYYMITPRGVAAAMEACDYENTYEKRQRSSGTGRRN